MRARLRTDPRRREGAGRKDRGEENRLSPHDGLGLRETL
jgi:hypothetical protein